MVQGKLPPALAVSVFAALPALARYLQRHRGGGVIGDTLSVHRLTAVLDQAPLGFHVFSATGATLLTNKAWDVIWRGETANSPGDNILTDPQIQATGLIPYLQQGIAGQVTITPPLRFDPVKGGPPRWLRGYIAPIADGAGETREVLLIEEDITAQISYEQQLRHRALHDPLTDLPNRILLLEQLDAAIGHASTAAAVVLFLLDFDRFKVVNDSLGHAAGDHLLVHMAGQLRETVGEQNLVARLGGDEFAIVASGIASPAVAETLAREVLAASRSTATITRQEIHTQVSIGVAFSDGSVPAAELLQHADMAMYAAKRAGGDQFRLFDPAMFAETHERLVLEADLRRALESDELVLHYQPIIDLRHEHPIGLEALVRWQHPTRGLLGPQSFIPLAEETGLIGTVGAHVLRLACQQLRAWRDVYPAVGDMTISVNVSARQFRGGRLSRDIERALQETALPAAALMLELTESALMDDPDAALRMLTQLKNVGVGLAIDDFGTGYSSLSQLRHLPVDQLKIDRSFVGELGQEPRSTAVIAAVLQLGLGLGLRTVAEGVESAATAAHLHALGCEAVQGYHYAKPLAAAQVTAWLAARSGAEPNATPLPATPASAYQPAHDR